MRKAIVSIIALAVSAWVADRAEAVSAIPLGKHSVADIRSSCSKAGGSFSVHPDGGGYGCIKNNCDGKGGTCTVACDNKTNDCYGTTPYRGGPGGKFPAGSAGVLQVLTASGDPRPKPLTGGNILDGGSGFGGQGPAATGSPLATGGAPASPPPVQSVR